MEDTKTLVGFLKVFKYQTEANLKFITKNGLVKPKHPNFHLYSSEICQVRVLINSFEFDSIQEI